MNVKNLVLGIGIFIVFMFLLHNGIRAFYPPPEYKTFCNTGAEFVNYPKVYPTSAENCTFPAALREQEQKCYADEGQPIYDYADNGCTTGIKECNYCQKDYNDAMKGYNKIIFIIAVIFGIVALMLGYGILSVEPVGSALMASGIGAIMYGTVANWENLGNFGRFVLLLLALILLIWIAMKINKKSERKRR